MSAVPEVPATSLPPGPIGGPAAWKGPEIDRNRTWLVTPEGGRRSELAVYLLRQAGLNAYLLNG